MALIALVTLFVQAEQAIFVILNWSVISSYTKLNLLVYKVNRKIGCLINSVEVIDTFMIKIECLNQIENRWL